MGAGIAAHLANCGLDVLLLDILPPELSADDRKQGWNETSPEWRNKLSIQALAGLQKSRRPFFTSEESFARVKVGNLEDDLHRVADYDWILETIIEKLEIKRPLFDRIEKLRRPDSIVTTNTSGLPIKQITAGMTAGFKQHFMGTHFFNPPTYIRLLEIIPGEETLPEAVDFMKSFCTERLSKDVIICKDTPNFIANRMGSATNLNAIHLAVKMGMRVEEVDALCGHVMARLDRRFPLIGCHRAGYQLNVVVFTPMSPRIAETLHLTGRDGCKGMLGTGRSGLQRVIVRMELRKNWFLLDIWNPGITPDFPRRRKMDDPAERPEAGFRQMTAVFVRMGVVAKI